MLKLLLLLLLLNTNLYAQNDYSSALHCLTGASIASITFVIETNHQFKFDKYKLGVLLMPLLAGLIKEGIDSTEKGNYWDVDDIKWGMFGAMPVYIAISF